jgi:hypothetical protein
VVEPRLTIELVPQTCWYSNVRSEVSQEQWDTIRRKVYAAAGHRCEVCGGRGPKWPVECHEVWHYDDEQHIQTLAGMIALCPACHEVKHIGRSMIVGRGAQALAHLAEVNGWNELEVTDYYVQAMQTWSERSKHEWTLDLSGLQQYL